MLCPSQGTTPEDTWYHFSFLNDINFGHLLMVLSNYPLYAAAAAAAKSLQSCPTPCDPIDGSSPGSAVPGILQARTLEWVAISFSNAWKWKVKVKLLRRVQLLATPWTAAHQAPPPMGFFRQKLWSGLPLPSPTHCIFIINNYEKINSKWCVGRDFDNKNTFSSIPAPPLDLQTIPDLISSGFTFF